MKPSSVPCFGFADGIGGSLGVGGVETGDMARFVSMSARGFFGEGDGGSDVARRFRVFGGVLGGLGVKRRDCGVSPPDPARLGGEDPRSRARPYVRTVLLSAIATSKRAHLAPMAVGAR